MQRPSQVTHIQVCSRLEELTVRGEHGGQSTFALGREDERCDHGRFWLCFFFRGVVIAFNNSMCICSTKTWYFN